MLALLLPAFLGFSLWFQPGMSLVLAPQSTAQAQTRDLKSDDVAVRRKAAGQLASMTDQAKAYGKESTPDFPTTGSSLNIASGMKGMPVVVRLPAR
jgi:hypothetical protein